MQKKSKENRQGVDRLCTAQTHSIIKEEQRELRSRANRLRLLKSAQMQQKRKEIRD